MMTSEQDLVLQVARDAWQRQSDLSDDLSGRIPAVFEAIRGILDMTFAEHLDWERLLLFGQYRKSVLQESIVGTLIAIKPGIVFLDGRLGERPTGFLIRAAGDGSKLLFQLLPLGLSLVREPLCIFSGPFAERNGWKHLGAYISLDQVSLGISISRWHGDLSPWLDKWLPAETASA